jgi:hypothetical protein
MLCLCHVPWFCFVLQPVDVPHPDFIWSAASEHIGVTQAGLVSGVASGELALRPAIYLSHMILFTIFLSGRSGITVSDKRLDDNSISGLVNVLEPGVADLHVRPFGKCPRYQVHRTRDHGVTFVQVLLWMLALRSVATR